MTTLVSRVPWGRVSGIMAKEGRRHPKRNLREISPGGAGVFYRGSLLAGHAQMLTPVKGLLRHLNCCLGKLVELTISSCVSVRMSRY